MFQIHYVVSRESDQPVEKETSAADTLDVAAAGARSRIHQINITIPENPARPNPCGFLIFDASGARLLRREYMGQP